MSRNEADRHFEYFKANALEIKGGERLNGKKPSTFSYLSTNKLPDKQVSRQELFAMVEDKSVQIDVLCISILAWGGVRKNNINNAFSFKNEWLPIAQGIRSGNYNRSQAYEAFYKLRKNKRLKGIGAAYFTKLIYFLMPNHKDKPRGYIMDQWVACSVNLLAEQNIILMNVYYDWKNTNEYTSTFSVSDINNYENYETYCQYIEKLSEKIDKSPDETEYFMMSEGGRTKEPWRDYVIKNRRIYE